MNEKKKIERMKCMLLLGRDSKGGSEVEKKREEVEKGSKKETSLGKESRRVCRFEGGKRSGRTGW